MQLAVTSTQKHQNVIIPFEKYIFQSKINDYIIYNVFIEIYIKKKDTFFTPTLSLSDITSLTTNQM